MSTIQPMAFQDLRLPQRLEKHLSQHLHIPGLFVVPDIPPKALKTARKKCFVSEAKHVLGLVDMSLDGSAENCLLITGDGIYFYNHSEGLSQSGAVSFYEFPERSLSLISGDQISFGRGESLSFTYSRADAFVIWEMLESIRLGLPGNDRLSREEDEWSRYLLETLKLYHPQDDFHLEPNIPPKKNTNARKVMNVPDYEPTLGLIDATIFGSAKNGLIFTDKHVYYANDWTGKSKYGRIPYEGFFDRTFTIISSHEISLDRGDTLVVSGCNMKKEVIIALLRAVAGTAHWRLKKA